MLYFKQSFKKILIITTGFLNFNLGSEEKKGGKRGFFVEQKPAQEMIFFLIISLAYSLLLCSPALAVSSLNINPEYGMVKEEFGYSYGDDSKTVIYIQDAHCNYEAQKNIANILEYLIKEQGIKMVFVEGGSEDSSLSYLRGYGSKQALNSIAEKKLKEGKISGEEYLNIISDLDFEIYGIEEPNLYNEQRDIFLKIDKYKAELVSFINSLHEITSQLKEKIYNAGLKDLENKRKAYENNQITLISYIEYLNELCLKHAVNASHYTNFSQLAEAVSLEKTIDYNLIGKEANAALNRLVEVLPESERALLLTEATKLEGKEQKKIYDFYIKIRGRAKEKSINLDAYRNLVSFTTFLQAFDSVNMQNLFSDIAGVNRAIITELVDKMEQWDIIDVDYGLGLFEKMVNVKLDKPEFDLYLEKKELVNPKSWVNSLHKLASKYKVRENLIKDTSQIEQALGSLERFYQLAFQRDNVFIEKIFTKMEEKQIDRAVLITGGFHASNLQALLEKAGARGVVVYPKVSTFTDEGLYNSRVKEELSELERLVSGQMRP